MSNLKPNCPKCGHNKRVTEWVIKLGNNIYLCKECHVTFDPDRPKEHDMLDCPLCGTVLVHQPTIGDNYRTATCYGMKMNEDGETSETLKCGYKVVFKDGIVENQQWTGQRKGDNGKSND